MSKKGLLTLNRNFVLTSVYGQSIQFEKGVPTHVPPLVYAEAIAIGAQPSDGSDPSLNSEGTSKLAEPIDPKERQDLLFAAFDDFVESNQREDFNAAGVPAAPACSKALGYKVQQKEVTAAWQEYQAKKAAE